MGWFEHMFSSPEKRAAKAIEEEKNYGIEGEYKRRYTFTIEQKHFIAPQYYSHYRIEGFFDCGLLWNNPSAGTQCWSIEMRNLVFDRNEYTIPEQYFMFSFPYRMDIVFDSSGQLVSGGTWIDVPDRWRHRYKKSIYEQIENKDRAGAFYDMMRSWGKKEALDVLKSNPLTGSLGTICMLNHRLNTSSSIPPGQFGELFTSDLIKKDYFCGKIALPLKTTWLRQELEDEEEERWIRLGGLDREKYQEEDFRKVMREITDVFNLEVPVHVEFSEVYQLERVRDNFRQMKYAEMQTSTLIKDIWAKHEHIELIEDVKGVVYG